MAEDLNIAQARQYAAAEGDWHIDAALTDISIQFNLSQDMYVAAKVLPTVPVNHQSDKFYTWDAPDWFRIPQTLRARGTAPGVIEASVSSAGYYANNYMLAGKIPYEDLANADAALDIEASTTRLVTQLLNLDMENRIATLLTTAANLGSGSTLSGTNQWSDRTGSDPVSDVTTGKSFIQLQTGFKPNTMVVGQQVHDALIQHVDILDRVKYVQRADQATLANALADIFGVDRYLVGGAIKNTGAEALAASNAFIWGKDAVLCYTPPMPGRNVPSAGYMFRWRPTGFQDMSVEVMDNETMKARFVRVGYFQDERVTAKDMAYVLKNAVG